MRKFGSPSIARQMAPLVCTSAISVTHVTPSGNKSVSNAGHMPAHSGGQSWNAMCLHLSPVHPNLRHSIDDHDQAPTHHNSQN
mmetsp:Transcript_42525/g.112199  ORF Transcript_42525/g.112199 Transcript_42525/m.112199 type:complete len:83 (+) Transcript_42525:100-348(+)